MSIFKNLENIITGAVKEGQAATSVSQEAAEGLAGGSLGPEAEAVQGQAETESTGRGGKGQLKKLREE